MTLVPRLYNNWKRLIEIISFIHMNGLDACVPIEILKPTTWRLWTLAICSPQKHMSGSIRRNQASWKWKYRRKPSSCYVPAILSKSDFVQNATVRRLKARRFSFKHSSSFRLLFAIYIYILPVKKIRQTGWCFATFVATEFECVASIRERYSNPLPAKSYCTFAILH